MDSTPLVSIIIPVHNQLQYTRQCLESLESNTDPGQYEVIVVNDDSHDGTAEFLRSLCEVKPWLRFVSNPHNLGFAGSCNQGAGLARAGYLLFLNNDTEVQLGWLSPLVEILEEQPDIGIVAPKLIFPDGSIQHCGKVWGEWQVPRSHPDHIYYREPGDAAHVNRFRDYQMLTGACLLLRRDEFLRIGPFDDQYENGWEDDDLCYAFREQGMRVHYCPASTVIHFQSVTLNEGLAQDEQQLKELSDRAITGAPHDPMLSALYQKVEQRLLAVRARFDRNRSRFFEKWGQRIFRDDYLYIQADGLSERFISDSPQQPLVSIIILTFNQLPYTIECVESIQQHTPERYELIFIDNGSSDGTVQWLQAFHTQYPSFCTVIVNDSNRGFAAGCNQGLSAARGDYLLLLNNDVVVTNGWLSGLLTCLHFHPSTGLVGPLTNHISGIQCLPGAPASPKENLDQFAEKIRTTFSGRRIYHRRIVGFCMLFSRELFNRVGYLDESFGSGNFEDDDFCLRAELEGYRNVIAGDVFIHHYGSVSFRGNKIDYGMSMSGNRSVFNQKWSRTITEPVLARKVITLKVFEEAERLNRQGRSNDVIDLLLKEGIAQLPLEQRFYRLIAEILIEAGMEAEALQTLEHTPRLDCDAAALRMLAQAACLRDRHDLVYNIVSRANRCHPAYPGLHVIRGMLAEREGNVVHAFEEFGAAARMDASLVDAYLGLARTREAQGDLAAAFDLFRLACTVAPRSRTAARALHRLATSSEQQRKARQTLEDALYFTDDDRDLRFLLIDLLVRCGEVQKALEHVERSMVLFGADPGLVGAACSLRRQIGPMSISPVPQTDGSSVSLCMIVKNEAKSLPRCLASLKPIVDEIVICDTGSTDTTRGIAEAFGACVIDHAWNGDFSAARNRTLAAAHGSWVLVMDADEVISPHDYYSFRELVKKSQSKRVAYTITTRNYTNKLVEKWQEHDGRYSAEEAGRGWMPSDKVRLFPNRPEIRFENAIHEMVEPSLERLGIPCPQTEDVVVHHYGYLDDERQETKKVQYYETGVRKLRESGGSPKAIVELAIQAAGIERYQEAIELWKRALAHNSESALVWFNLGYAHLCLGHYDQAFDATKRSLELQPDYREARANLALIETLRGRHQAALEILGHHSEDSEGYVMFDLVRAVAYCCGNRHQMAGELFRAVVNRQIEFVKFIETTVRHLRQSGRNHDANTLLATAREGGCVIP